MMKTRRILYAALAALAAAGCSPSFEMITRSSVEPGESKSFFLKNFTFEIFEWPSGESPEIAVRIQKQKFWVDSAKGVKKQYKKYSDGTLEEVPGSKKETMLFRVSGKSEWTPAPAETVTFNVVSVGRATSASTDEAGIARFNVSGFAEDWIEGRDLQVEVKADLFALEDPQALEKAKNKHPSAAKEILKERPREFFESVSVGTRVLQRIFESR